MVERASAVYSDPAAARYVWGTGFHWYNGNHFEHVQQLHDAWPDKQLLFTEGCQEGGPHTGSWELGERYAHSMINDLNRWTVGWIDWNLLLDEQGGPNHVGNFCSAPMLADTTMGSLLPQSSYAYIGHFARFVRTGARRALCAATKEALECTAFVNDDGSLASRRIGRGVLQVVQHAIDIANYDDIVAIWHAWEGDQPIGAGDVGRDDHAIRRITIAVWIGPQGHGHAGDAGLLKDREVGVVRQALVDLVGQRGPGGLRHE